MREGGPICGTLRYISDIDVTPLHKILATGLDYIKNHAAIKEDV